MSSLEKVDPEINTVIENEKRRQDEGLNFIASENYAGRAVLEAQGSVLTNKYAEGYPRARYYSGCQNIDRAEELAIERAKELFGAEHANVQPHSGSQANMAAYFALLENGDTVLGMSLSHGGHLTHGSPVNFSSKLYRFALYGIDRETEMLNYDEIEKLAIKHKPKLIVAGASSYPRIIDFARFRQIADRVGAKLMADIAHIAGLVSTGLHPNPVPYAEVVTSTTHKTLRGPRGGFILCQKDLASAINRAVFPCLQGGPLMHVIAAKAVAFHEAQKPEFKTYQKAVIENAKTLASELKKLGLRIVSGGTDNHLVLVDLSDADVTGKQAEEALSDVGIYVNRNAIPFDPKPPRLASGIRLGTPAVTTRGLGTSEMKRIASLIIKTISVPDDEKEHRKISEEVKEISKRFPVHNFSG